MLAYLAIATVVSSVIWFVDRRLGSSDGVWSWFTRPGEIPLGPWVWSVITGILLLVTLVVLLVAVGLVGNAPCNSALHLDGCVESKLFWMEQVKLGERR